TMSAATALLLVAPQAAPGHAVSVITAGEVALVQVCHCRQSVRVDVSRQYRTRIRLSVFALPAPPGRGFTVCMIRSHGPARTIADGCGVSVAYALALRSSRAIRPSARRASS